jgi:hypothetical protein
MKLEVWPTNPRRQSYPDEYRATWNGAGYEIESLGGYRPMYLFTCPTIPAAFDAIQVYTDTLDVDEPEPGRHVVWWDVEKAVAERLILPEFEIYGER